MRALHRQTQALLSSTTGFGSLVVLLFSIGHEVECCATSAAKHMCRYMQICRYAHVWFKRHFSAWLLASKVLVDNDNDVCNSDHKLNLAIAGERNTLQQTGMALECCGCALRVESIYVLGPRDAEEAHHKESDGGGDRVDTRA